MLLQILWFLWVGFDLAIWCVKEWRVLCTEQPSHAISISCVKEWSVLCTEQQGRKTPLRLPSSQLPRSRITWKYSLVFPTPTFISGGRWTVEAEPANAIKVPPKLDSDIFNIFSGFGMCAHRRVVRHWVKVVKTDVFVWIDCMCFHHWTAYFCLLNIFKRRPL